MSPTISYITGRRNSRFSEWFLPGLARQVLPGEEVTVIKIDRFAEEPSEFVWRPPNSVPEMVVDPPDDAPKITVHVHPPKPSVWYGPHKLVKQDWFAASSFRNTALCLTKTTHIAYCDDLSVPHPQWWQAAKEAACFPETTTCGLYQKVRDLVVEDGKAVSFTTPATGLDRRMKLTGSAIQGKADYTWMFGCSLVAPIEALLQAGGWPEMADGLSFEDCLLAVVLGNNGVQFRYDRRLFTYEDEAAHHEEPPMIRRDKGVSPDDKSHAALRIARKSKEFHNYYEGGTRALREHVLAGNPFPVIQCPQHDWYDGMLISEMDSIL